jgi:hypothetical protein
MTTESTRPYAHDSQPSLVDIGEAIRGVTKLLRAAEEQGIAESDDAIGALGAISILNALSLSRLPEST